MKSAGVYVVFLYAFLVAASLSSCVTNLTPVPREDRMYRAIIETEHDENVEYRIANEWFVDTFVSAESVIQYQDQEAGIIKGKGKIAVFEVMGDTLSVDCVLTVEVKPKRVRITFDEMSSPSSLTGGDGYHSGVHDMFLEKAEIMVASLEKAFENPDVDW